MRLMSTYVPHNLLKCFKQPVKTPISSSLFSEKNCITSFYYLGFSYSESLLTHTSGGLLSLNVKSTAIYWITWTRLGFMQNNSVLVTSPTHLDCLCRTLSSWKAHTWSWSLRAIVVVTYLLTFWYWHFLQIRAASCWPLFNAPQEKRIST